MRARIDGTPVRTCNAGGVYSGIDGYWQVNLNLDAYADGGSQVLTFFSVSGATGMTDFFIDDVTAITTAVPEPAGVRCCWPWVWQVWPAVPLLMEGRTKILTSIECKEITHPEGTKSCSPR